MSFGLIVGSDGDTDDYLERLPEYLDDLGPSCITFLGIVCPYPETPFYETVAREGRLLPDVISRDLDGYTLCHRPKRLEVRATVEHFKRLCTQIGSFKSLAKNTWPQLWMSRAPRYKSTVLTSALECRSLRNPLANPERTFVAGSDPLETWDAQKMVQLGIAPQRIEGMLSAQDKELLRPSLRKPRLVVAAQ
jgi:radical SAM superfamily enzyme YgiQ (UPF0313 family)